MNRQEELLAGGRRQSGRCQSRRVVSNKEMEGKLQSHSGLMLMAQVPGSCWNQMQTSHLWLQLEGLYVGDLLYFVKDNSGSASQTPILLGVRKQDLLMVCLIVSTLISISWGILDGIPRQP